MPDNNWVLVGVINGAHGVRGLLKVKSLSDNPSRFVPGRCLYTQKTEAARQRSEKILSRPLIIESVTPHQGKLLIAFAGINSREEAAALLGAELMAEPDTAPLPEGQYYHYQLLGIEVYDRGEYRGKITEILSYPANDIYVMENEAGEEILIPALKTVVKNIDLSAGRMEVEMTGI
ncbi:MAG: ribosome maturation factor RimM [Clostridiales bacterium]|nr:ribosome maturation factor RimM [Clostridiales bacterium]